MHFLTTQPRLSVPSSGPKVGLVGNPIGPCPCPCSRPWPQSIAASFMVLVGGADGSSSGQSLVETALLLPVLLMLLFNAVNFGYFFLVALNVAPAPRSGVAYSIQGYASPSSGLLPSAGPSTTTATVSYLTYQDM